MKLGPETKLDKKNKTTSKKLDDDVMSENCDVIVILVLPRTSKQTPKEPTQIKVKMKKEKMKVFKATKKKSFNSVF